MAENSGMALDAIGASLGSKTTVAGAGAGLVGWVSSTDWLGLGGVTCAIIGLIINLYFQFRRDGREEAESIARIKLLQSELENGQS